MSVFVLLDILLLILIALFVPIGFWRGAQREVLVTLGILAGAALANAWAEPWGRELAELTRLRETGGAFMVSVLFLIGVTFLLGYGAGAAMPLPQPGLISRFFGALIAGANGALLLSYALRDIRLYLLPQANAGFLDHALVANFLSTGAGWLLLGFAALFLPVVVGLALFGRGSVVVDDYGEADAAFERGYTPSPRRLPPRLPGLPEAEETATYKAEPPRHATHGHAEETRPLAYQPGNHDHAWGGQARSDALETQAIVVRAPAAAAEETVEISAMPAETVETSRSSLDEGRCPACHADVSQAEVFCPSCGRVL